MWINAENIINKFSLCVGFTTRPDMMRAIQIIKDEPGIDIVRCKECMFADVDVEAEMARCSLVSFPLWNRGDHFCSDGEREGE